MKISDIFLVKLSWWSLRKATWMLWLAFLGALLMGVVVFTLYIKSLPALSTWHTTTLNEEFTAEMFYEGKVKNFDDYLALEERLFNELEQKIFAKIKPDEKNRINRYTQDSISNPNRWSKEWNRSFEMPVDNAKIGVLLIHGMSDSPYSLHTQAEALHKKGVWVVGLRMPGHGTIPSGLTSIKWQDMIEVVKIGMNRLNQKLGDRPIHIIGYSTGASLALSYTLSALDNKATMRLPTGLVFYSPAIGVSKAAPLAVWQSRLGHLLGMQKLEWNSISPEYDPFKYGSFAVNAGDQVYRICNQVQKQFDNYLSQKQTKSFPSILSFSSIVDSTVSISAVVDNLYKRLTDGNHTLVLFDVNHNFGDNHFIKERVKSATQILRNTTFTQNQRKSSINFDLITNQNSHNGSIIQIRNRKIEKNLNLHWSKELYSLSHLALPISKYDPLYGGKSALKSPGIQLGHLAIYGETSVLQTSAASLLRQRWNPFYDYTEERIFEFMGVE